MKLIRGYWTKERCREEARKYKSVNEFKENSRYSFDKSLKNKWLSEFFIEYSPKIIPKERCQEEALKYLSRNDFKFKSLSEYEKARKSGWLDEICSHMTIKPSSYWTKERCQEEALLYKTRTEFKNKSYQAYKYSLINCWFDDICSHMPIIGNMYKRCIYAFEFADNSVYVGLTYNLNKRSESHFKSLQSQVNRHISKTGLQPKIVKLSDYIDVNLAKIKEGEFIEFYRNNNWFILNIQKSGGVGGKLKHTREECFYIVNKYKNLYDFRKNEPNIYKTIIRYNWNDILSLLERNFKEHGYWTKEKCQEVALKYNNRIDFFKLDVSAYNKSQKSGWLNDICSHMSPKWKRL